MAQPAYLQTALTADVLQSLIDKGFSLAEIGRQYNLSRKELATAIRNLGVTYNKRIKDGTTHRRPYGQVSEKYRESHQAQFDEFLRLHNEGLTFTQIAEKCGCSLSQVGKLFTVYGYSFDTAYKTKAAHDAIKGAKRTYEDLCKRAIAKQFNHPKLTRWESLFFDFLRANDIPFTCSKAIGKYNVDFLVDTSIAVELFGGSFHATGRAADRLHERMKFLIENGFNVYIVWCLSDETSIFPGCFDDFVTFRKSISGNETPVGQYRVIWSDGDFISCGSLESDYLAAVKPATFRNNALSKYKAPRD